ncbi:MAG: 3-deoxy-manno-octulosonate cytidylyltransferase [Bacteriovoracaceae bacterium]|nr:3-deoxy-manno-octulosonate cytidylyltransferase [Bacteriovoracaceae bacterium]
MSEVLVLIPARYQSSRFPGKPLAPINGKSMIQRVYENVSESGYDTFVVTDSDEIAKHLDTIKAKYLRVDDDVPSGTERIALAYERNFLKKKYKLIINIQGDEPLLHAEEVKKLAKFHLDSQFDVATLVRKRKPEEADYKNPNVVKVAYSEKTGACFYFSRASIPFDRDDEKNFSWFHHVGVYSYKAEPLLAFLKHPASVLEKIEKLEQLRALEMGFTLGASVTKYESIGVDTKEDIKKIEGVLSGKK